ncbi:MAG: FecR domain-containing protein [Opitutaceae bacterium]|nr:FecR domain-containing protein [Opitutaceae bacterium]
MNSSHRHVPDSQFDEQAAEWLLEREEGFASGRAAAFVEWCNADPRHAEAVARVEQTLFLLEEMPAVRGPLEQRVGRARRGPGPRHAVPVRALAWAAGLAAALVVGFAVWPRSQPGAPAGEPIVSNASEPRRVALADGSVVDLNANSQVRVDFSAEERRIALGAGEAHFQVAHNASRPFIVTANGVSVRAVGTAFNVRLLGDEVDILVTEGQVAVSRARSPAATAVLPALVAGERAQVSAADAAAPQVQAIPPATVYALLAWQDRMTSFTDVPLREMIVRINRCNATKLVIDDPGLGDRRIGGVIDLKQVNAFVDFLEREGDIVAERRFNGEILLRRAR